MRILEWALSWISWKLAIASRRCGLSLILQIGQSLMTFNPTASNIPNRRQHGASCSSEGQYRDERHIAPSVEDYSVPILHCSTLYYC
jgi:hypothetical protein